MLQENVTSVTYEPDKSDNNVIQQNPFNWFFEEKDIELPSKEKIKLSFIRAGIPLMQLSQNQFAFLHKSLLDFFAAKHLFTSAMMEASLAVGLGLNDKFLVDEPDILQFITDKVRENEALQKSLFKILEETKYDARLEKAGSNAITLLHRAGVLLKGKNFQGVRIPKAYLAGAEIDDCDFREADLREVNLTSASLNQVKMSGALMQGIQLGQKPIIVVGSEVNSLAYSPKGDMLAAGCDDKTIKLYKVSQYNPFKVLDDLFSGHIAKVNAVAFSPDGHILASGSSDTTIRFWDPVSGKCITTLEGHSKSVNTLIFSPDGYTLASGNSDTTIRLWYPASGKCITTLVGHTDSVYTLIFSSDGHTLASGSYDRTIRLWHLASGKPITTLEGHLRPVTTLSFSPDGHTLASGSTDTTIRLWDSTSGKHITTLEGHTLSVQTLAFNPDGHILASGSLDNTIRLWQPTSGKHIMILTGHTGGIHTLTFNPDGQTLVSGSYDNTIRLWDPASNKHFTIRKGHTGYVNTLSFSPDGYTLASGSVDNTIHLWNPASGKHITTLEGHTRSVKTLSFSPNGYTLASGGIDNTIRLWHPTSGKYLRTLKGHTSPVRTLAFSLNGQVLASGGHDATIRLWHPASGKCFQTLKGHTYWIYTLTFSPDGHILASGSYDTTIRLWHPASGKCLYVLKGHTDSINALTFSSDGQTLASGGSDNLICLWHVASGKYIATLQGHTNGVNTLIFSPDGSTLASGSSDNTIRLWNMQTLKTVQTLSFKDIVNSISWHQNYSFAVAYGEYMQCGYLKDKEFIVYWKTENPKLESKNSQLGGVVGLSDEDYNLLTQEGGEGTPSTKTVDYIIAQRQAPVPYDPKKTRTSFFAANHNLMPDAAIVSLVRKKGNWHVFLIIETVEDNFYKIYQADLFLDQSKKYILIGLYGHGQVRVELVPKTFHDMEQLIEGGCEFKTWPPIEKADLNKLLDNIIQDQNIYQTYDSLAALNFNAQNCVTWCDKQLIKIGLDPNVSKWEVAKLPQPKTLIKEEKTQTSMWSFLSFFWQKSSVESQSNNNNEKPGNRK